MILEIDDVDYSHNVLTDGYLVNSTDVTVEYTDAAYRTHKKVMRRRIKGTFNMLFRTPAEYAAFASHINSLRSTSGLFYCKVKVNNINDLVFSRFYLTFSPERTRRDDGVELMKSFKVTLEEE